MCKSSRECAKAMGVQLNTFYHLINGREANGTRWVITKHKIGEVCDGTQRHNSNDDK